ncbi:Fc.00g095600.m01.CDS01 [Cosmosporella sp. VM-42]
MLKGFSVRVFFLPAALITQLLLLAGLGVLLRAGTGSLNNTQHLPITPGLYLVLIDADQYTQKIGKETYHGLPDSHDFSKEKDFFALFPALYCSGKKNGDRYEADFCSSWGRQLFDLQRLWRVWGVDLIQDKLIGSSPTFIYAGFLTATAAVGLSAVFCIFAFCSYWSAVVATLSSWISTIAAITTAALSHIFVSRLVAQAAILETTGSGKVVALWGRVFFRAAWMGAGLALLASTILSFVLWRLRKGRSKAKQHTFGSPFPLMGVVRRATGGFRGQSSSYKHVEQEMHDVGLPESRKTPRTVSISRSPSPELKDSGLDSRGQLLATDTAYEPMRHRSIE